MGELWRQLLLLVFGALKFFQSWTGDWGVAIILLTVAMRVLLIPLTVKQTKSMHEMQAIQPKLKALQDKHKNDKEKLQEETLKFYQENKVNPFGGCLPLVIQMPVFIALFQVLGVTNDPNRPNLINYIKSLPIAAQSAAKQFLFIVPDITLSPANMFAGKSFAQAIIPALPYLALVALFALSAWLPQYMMTKDPQQRKMGAYMSIFMIYIGWISPAGVLLYWVTSSAWQIAQQAIMLRAMPHEEGA